MLAEHRLHTSDLIWPLFIAEGKGEEQPVDALPGVSRWSVTGWPTRPGKRAISAFPASRYSPIRLRASAAKERKKRLTLTI